MATVYKVEITSHFTNYSEKELQRILEQAVKSIGENGNTLQVEVKGRE